MGGILFVVMNSNGENEYVMCGMGLSVATTNCVCYTVIRQKLQGVVVA